jgi:hypothetical protein
MSRITVLASFLLIAVSVCAAREPWAPTQTAATGAQPVGHAAIPVLLSKSLDAKKLKVGDEVTAKTSVSLRGGGILIPSGSIVIGHVTSAEARSKGDPQSSLGLAFDKVEVLGGKVLLIHGLIRAVGPNPNPEPNTGAAEAGTIAADTGHDQGATVPGPVSYVGELGSTDNHGPLLSPHGSGVLGIRNLQLDKNSVLVTNAKDLKLESGTQFVIQAEVQQPVQ